MTIFGCITNTRDHGKFVGGCKISFVMMMTIASGIYINKCKLYAHFLGNYTFLRILIYLYMYMCIHTHTYTSSLNFCLSLAERGATLLLSHSNVINVLCRSIKEYIWENTSRVNIQVIFIPTFAQLDNGPLAQDSFHWPRQSSLPKRPVKQLGI